jgi:hypothetical protein
MVAVLLEVAVSKASYPTGALQVAVMGNASASIENKSCAAY